MTGLTKNKSLKHALGILFAIIIIGMLSTAIIAEEEEGGAYPLNILPVPMASGIFPNVGSTPGASWNVAGGTLTVYEGAIHCNLAGSPWGAYSGQITNIIFDGPITAGASLRDLFAGLTHLVSIEGLDYFDVSNTTSMVGMFNGASSLVHIEGLSGWDTGNVQFMQQMFQGASSLVSIECLSGWDTGSVTTMASMFSGASSLINLEISGWDTSNVAQMSWMFSGASSLETVGDLSGWDTSSLMTIHRIFSGASSLTSLNLSDWDTSRVENMYSLFRDTTALTSIEGLSGWDTSSATNMASMFNGAVSLEILDLSGWDTRSVTLMSRMFDDAASLTCVGGLSGWDVSNVTQMIRMFEGASSLESLDLSDWDTDNVQSMYRMFAGASSLMYVGDLSDWNTSSVTNIARMFNGVSSLTTLDLFGWDTRNVEYMSQMFYHASGLVSIEGLSGWDTSNVTSMHRMFEGAISLETLDLSGWDTGSVTQMNRMFAGAISLRQLTLGENFSFVAGTGAALPNVPNTSGYSGFWRNIGNGTIYVPAGPHTLTSAQLMSTFDGLAMADTWVWLRMFGISPLADHVFPPEYEGYDPQTPHMVTVTSVGSMPTGDLTVTVTGDAFTLSTDTLVSIVPGETASFTVVPNTGLPVGTHTATVTVFNTGSGILESFTVSFTVLLPPSFDVTYEVTGMVPATFTPAIPAQATHQQGTAGIAVALVLTTTEAAHNSVLGVWVFSGWETDSAGVTIEYGEFTMPGNDVVFTGYWTFMPADSFSVTYEVIGPAPMAFAPAIPAQATHQQGTAGIAVAPVLTTTEATHNGVLGVWVFSGWETDSAGVTIEYGEFTMPGSDVAFTGYWTFTPNASGGGSGNDYGNDDGGTWVANSPAVRPPTPRPTPPIDLQLVDMPYTIIPDTFSPYHNSFIIGRPDGNIAPGDNITRAEVTTIFFRLFSDDFRVRMWNQQNPFSDVNSADWFNNSISTVANADIVQGRPNGAFDPNYPITRAEVAAITARFFEETGHTQDAFTDIAGHWAEGYINRLAHFGWVQGSGDGTFRPEDQMTRAEVAALINRMLSRVPESADSLLDGHMRWRDMADINAWYYLYLQEASHSTEFERLENGYLNWTAILPYIDWSLLIHSYSRPDDILVSRRR